MAACCGGLGLRWRSGGLVGGGFAWRLIGDFCSGACEMSEVSGACWLDFHQSSLQKEWPLLSSRMHRYSRQETSVYGGSVAMDREANALQSNQRMNGYR